MNPRNDAISTLQKMRSFVGGDFWLVCKSYMEVSLPDHSMGANHVNDVGNSALLQTRWNPI